MNKLLFPIAVAISICAIILSEIDLSFINYDKPSKETHIEEDSYANPEITHTLMRSEAQMMEEPG